MKKRRKHHKDDEKPFSIPTENLTIPKQSNAESDDSNRKTSNSRSRSGTRRPISALFRRSASRNPSSDRENEIEQEQEEATIASPEVDPRINPRTHLQRMTVREALVYNRKRGRSPNRRALKLEERLSQGDRSKSTEDLNVATGIADGIQTSSLQSTDDEVRKKIVKVGATLPRLKKKRVQLDPRVTFEQLQKEFSDNGSVNNDINELPLDKRKYLINRDGVDCVDDAKINLDESIDTSPKQHSSIDDDRVGDEFQGSSKTVPVNKIPPYIPLKQAPQENLPPVDRSSTWKTRILTSLPHINISKSSTLESMQDVGESIDVHAQVHNDRDNTNIKSIKCDNSSERIKSVSSNESTDISDNYLSKDAISRQVSTASSDQSRSRRSSYVSPRRFSRTSRTSTTSNRSALSDTGIQSAVSSPGTNPFSKGIQSPVTGPIIDPFAKDMLSVGSKPKYVRHFSRESRKSVSTVPEQVHKIMEDKETNTDIPYEMKFVTSATQTSLPELVTHSASVGCSTDDIELEPISGEDITHETVVATLKSALRKSNMKREIVVIEQDTPDRRIGRTSVDSAFKPIKVDRTRKMSEANAIDPEIEVIQEVKTSKSDDNIRHGNKKLGKKSKGSRKTSFVKGKKRGSVIEDEVFEVEDQGTTKRKSKKDKKRPQSDSKDSKRRTKSESRDDRSHSTPRKSKKNQDKIERKSRSLSRKKTDNCNKTIFSSLKRVGRSASMNELCDSRESLKTDKTKIDLKKDNLSKSLDSVNTSVDENFQESIKKMKVKKKTPPKLSLVSVVALKSKFARMKKKKDVVKDNLETEQQENVGFNEDTAVIDEEAKNENGDDLQIVDNDDDLSMAKMYYENEVNTSIGKSLNSLAIVDPADQEVKDYVFEKRIQFSTPYDDTLSEEDMIKQRQRNTRLTERRESKVRLRQKKVISCCKKFIAFLFSHIGLCSLVVAYCILGGIIFKELEGAHEIEKKKEMTELRQNYTNRIHLLAFETTLTKGSREKFKDEVNAILKNFSVIIHKQTKEAGWDGQEIENLGNSTTQEIQPEQWSYPSSLLYAITVMTTIGYGHVAPKTDEGRIMTIAYAVLGIPLTLLCLTNIGDVMAHGFRMLYGKVCCGVCCILFKPRRRRRQDAEKGIPADRIIIEDEKSNEPVHVPTSVCLLLMTSYIMLGTILFSYWESWDYVTGTYFCFITLSTIGFGDVVPGMSQKEWNQHEKLVSCALYLVLGLSLIAMCFNLVQEDVKAKCRWLGMKLGIIDKPVSSV